MSTLGGPPLAFPSLGPRNDAPPGPGGSGIIQILADEVLMRRLVGAESGDCVSALRSLNLDDSFWIWEFKVVPCAKSYSHKWTLCPCAHAGETARRRCPRQFNYKAVLCPLVKAKKNCPLGDACSYSHNVFEHWLHPSRYKTRLCSFGRNCNRPICFFAHSAEELRCVPNSEEKVEMDDLMQLLLAQEAGLLNPSGQSLADSLSSPQPGTQQAPMQHMASADLSRSMHQRSRTIPSAAESALLASLGLHGPSSLDTQRMSGSFDRTAASMERAPSVPLDHGLGLPHHPHHPHHHPMRQMSRSHSGHTGIPGFDFPMPAAPPRPLMHTSSGSVNSVHSEPVPPLNAATATALQQHLDLEALAAPMGRLSDPGTMSWAHPVSGVSAFANSVNPVPHLNRISDSGNTLGMISAAAAGLESLLPLVNSALASGRLQVPRAAVSSGSKGGSPRHNGSNGASGSPLQSGSPPTPSLLATAASAGSDGTPFAEVRSDSPEPSPSSGSPTAVAAPHTGKQADSVRAPGVSPFANGGPQAQGANAAAAAVAAVMASAAAGNAPPNAAVLNNLMMHLQEQGLASNKEQLVASLSQLLAQLLSVK